MDWININISYLENPLVFCGLLVFIGIFLYIMATLIQKKVKTGKGGEIGPYEREYTRPLVYLSIILMLGGLIGYIIIFVSTISDSAESLDDTGIATVPAPLSGMNDTQDDIINRLEETELQINIIDPQDYAYVKEDNSLVVKGTASRLLVPDEEYLWIVEGLSDKEWYPQETNVSVRSDLKWKQTIYASVRDCNIEIAALIVGEELNSKFVKYIEDQDPMGYVPYDNTTEIISNIKYSIDVEVLDSN